jgi:hypothetical protein
LTWVKLKGDEVSIARGNAAEVEDLMRDLL